MFNLGGPKLLLHMFAISAVVVAGGVIGSQLRASGSASEKPHDTVTFEVHGTPLAGSEGTLSMGNNVFASQPRALTPEECSDARPRMEAQVQLWEKQLQTMSEGKSLENQLAAAVEDSRTWFDAGCRSHDKLGFYDATDGTGAIKSLLLDFP